MEKNSIWIKRLDENREDILIITTFCQLIEKIIRFKNFLRKATYAIELNEPIPKIIDHLDGLIEDEKKLLVQRFRNYSFNYETCNKNALYNQLLTSSTNINTCHERLQWVFCPWPEKVTNDFLKQVFKEAIYNDKFEALNGTIVVINEYNFWQFAPYKEPPRGKKTHIFGLPKIEFENCILWQTLLHEVGHALIDENELLEIDAILDNPEINAILGITEGKILDKQKTLENWITEFGSDLIALKTIGPSYLITLIIYSITNTNGILWDATEEHPPIKLRIEFMKAELDRTGMRNLNVELDKYFSRADELFGLRLKRDREFKVTEEEEFQKEFFKPEHLENMVTKISEKLEKSYIIDKFCTESFEKGAMLAERLSDGILISSSPKNNYNYTEIKEDELKHKGEELNEYPNKMTEIITGGTLSKWNLQTSWLLDLFDQRNKSDNECFEDYTEKLNDFDIIVSKSIETALVHSYFVNSKEFEGG